MAQVVRCPACGARNRLLEATNESVLAIAGELRLAVALQRLVDAARELSGASFAAVGVPGQEGTFAAWVTSGLGASAVTKTPAARGLLGRMLVVREPCATNDVHADPQFEGWPEGYPDLKSFLGFPIVAESEVVGAFYLANENTWGFSGDERRLIELLAPHAALAIRNAHLHERSRELSVLEERNRLARDLHDSVTQSLFSMRLAADTTLTVLDEREPAAREHIQRLSELAGSALAEMRALIHELLPPSVEDQGLATSLRRHADVLRHLHGVEITVDVSGGAGLEARCESELFMVAREALANALKHAGATVIRVDVRRGDDGTLRLVVADDGCGFDTAAPQKNGHLGLVTMRERAQAAGGRLTVASAPGGGTVVTVEVGR